MLNFQEIKSVLIAEGYFTQETIANLLDDAEKIICLDGQWTRSGYVIKSISAGFRPKGEFVKTKKVSIALPTFEGTKYEQVEQLKVHIEQTYPGCQVWVTML